MSRSQKLVTPPPSEQDEAADFLSDTEFVEDVQTSNVADDDLYDPLEEEEAVEQCYKKERQVTPPPPPPARTGVVDEDAAVAAVDTHEYKDEHVDMGNPSINGKSAEGEEGLLSAHDGDAYADVDDTGDVVVPTEESPTNEEEEEEGRPPASLFDGLIETQCIMCKRCAMANSPVVLHPCGHTVCQTCAKPPPPSVTPTIADDRDLGDKTAAAAEEHLIPQCCPCGATITHRSVNVMLCNLYRASLRGSFGAAFEATTVAAATIDDSEDADEEDNGDDDGVKDARVEDVLRCLYGAALSDAPPRPDDGSGEIPEANISKKGECDSSNSSRSGNLPISIDPNELPDTAVVKGLCYEVILEDGIDFSTTEVMLKRLLERIAQYNESRVKTSITAKVSSGFLSKIFGSSTATATATAVPAGGGGGSGGGEGVAKAAAVPPPPQPKSGESGKTAEPVCDDNVVVVKTEKASPLEDGDTKGNQSTGKTLPVKSVGDDDDDDAQVQEVVPAEQNGAQNLPSVGASEVVIVAPTVREEKELVDSKQNENVDEKGAAADEDSAPSPPSSSDVVSPHTAAQGGSTRQIRRHLVSAKNVTQPSSSSTSAVKKGMSSSKTAPAASNSAGDQQQSKKRAREEEQQPAADQADISSSRLSGDTTGELPRESQQKEKEVKSKRSTRAKKEIQKDVVVSPKQKDTAAASPTETVESSTSKSTPPPPPAASPTVAQAPAASPTLPAADAEVQIYWDAENISGRPYTFPAVLLMSILDQFVADGIISSNASHCTQVYFVDRENCTRSLSDQDKSALRDAQCTLIQCTKRKEDADRQIAAAIRRQIDNKHNPTSRPIVIVSSDKDFNSILQDAKRAGLPTYVIHEAPPKSMHENLLKFYAATYHAKDLVTKHRPESMKIEYSSKKNDVKQKSTDSSKTAGKTADRSAAPTKQQQQQQQKQSQRTVGHSVQQPPTRSKVNQQAAAQPSSLSASAVNKQQQKASTSSSSSSSSSSNNREYVIVNKVPRPIRFLVQNDGLKKLLNGTTEQSRNGKFCSIASKFTVSHDVHTCGSIHVKQVKVGEDRAPVAHWTLNPSVEGYKAATDPRNARVRNYWWCPNQAPGTCPDGDRCKHLHERYTDVWIPPLRSGEQGEQIALPFSFFEWNLGMQLLLDRDALSPRSKSKDDAVRPVVCAAFLKGACTHNADTCRALHPRIINLNGGTRRRVFATEVVPNPGAQLAVHAHATFMGRCESCKNPNTCSLIHLRTSATAQQEERPVQQQQLQQHSTTTAAVPKLQVEQLYRQTSYQQQSQQSQQQQQQQQNVHHPSVSANGSNVGLSLYQTVTGIVQPQQTSTTTHALPPNLHLNTAALTAAVNDTNRARDVLLRGRSHQIAPAQQQQQQHPHHQQTPPLQHHTSSSSYGGSHSHVPAAGNNLHHHPSLQRQQQQQQQQQSIALPTYQQHANATANISQQTTSNNTTNNANNSMPPLAEEDVKWAETFIQYYGLDLDAVFTSQGYPRLKQKHEELHQLGDQKNGDNLRMATKYLRSVKRLADRYKVPVVPYTQ